MSTRTLSRCLTSIAVSAAIACGSASQSPTPAAGSGDAWATCGADLDCVAAAIASTLVTDPQQAVAIVQRAPTPETQWLLVTGAVHNNPQHGAILCTALKDRSLKLRCEQDTSRPHLYAKPPRQQTKPGLRTAPGPHTSTLVLRIASRSTLAQVEPQAGSCTAGASFASCATDLAHRYAQGGQATEAAGACLAIPSSGRWRGECAFRAAETIAGRRIPTEAGSAIELCLMSGEWVGRCVDKVHESLAELAPAATGSAADWAPALATWNTMSQTWSRQGDTIAMIVQDAWWSEVVTYAYRRVRTPTGDPLDHLPAPAHPHIRAAAAWLSMITAPSSTPTLAGQVASLKSTLALRTDGASTALPHAHSRPRKDHWAVDEGDEGALAAVHYLGTSRRVVADEEEIDLQLSILEAAARRDQRWAVLLREGSRSDDPRVAATARRLTERTTRGSRPQSPPRKR